MQRQLRGGNYEVSVALASRCTHPVEHVWWIVASSYPGDMCGYRSHLDKGPLASHAVWRMRHGVVM
jgi:hypothetical protein